MTTPLHRPVRRELDVPGYATQIVTIAREGIYFRPKGRRVSLLLPWPRGLLLAARLEAERIVQERRAKRKARHGASGMR